MSKDPYKYFRIEARELTQALSEGTLELEKQTRPDLVQKLLRQAHTLKGAARVVKQSAIADACHAIETALEPHRTSDARVPAETANQLLGLLDEIAKHLAALSPEVSAAAGSTGAIAIEEVAPAARTETTDVDALVEGLRETYVQFGVLRKAAARLEHAHKLAELVAGRLAGRGPKAARRAAVAETGTMALLEELLGDIGAIDRGLASALEQMDRELGQVRETAEQLRLVPGEVLFSVLERAARDTAHALGRKVAFRTAGEGVRVDGQVLAVLQPALVQMVRNAVAHGIEPDAARRAAGKPVPGTITVQIARRDRRIVFHCADDGRGFDLDAVRRAAVESGMTHARVQDLDARELIELLLHGGISTSREVTELSGRGIGLDIVREASERLGGKLAVRTEAGKGTTIEIAVPLSLASVPGLAVKSGGIAATIPLASVKRTMRIRESDVSRSARGEAVIHEGRVIPFVQLEQALRRAPTRDGRARSAVVVESGGRLAAIGVEHLIGTENVMLRPLPAWTPADEVIAGAAIDAEGNPQLVLDPAGIVDAAMLDKPADSAPLRERASLLVIDDSLTTRMLEQSILESAGYDVDVATSGEEGLVVARRKAYALILVDVEMPGIDGFTFIEKIRADPALRHVPAILVTSRSAPEDRARGEQVGAQGYVVKSEFDQTELLGRIARLLEQ